MSNVDMRRIGFILSHMYGTNGGRGAPVAVIGPPGGGKTTWVKDLARRYFGGRLHTLPVPRVQGTDIAVPIPDHARKTVALYTSQELADLAALPDGVLYLDEITRPPDNSTNAAILAIMLEREIGPTKLDNVFIAATCNPAEQVGGVDLDPAYINRLVLLQWPAATVEGFTDHMIGVAAVGGQASVDGWPAPSETWREGWPDAWDRARAAVSAFLRIQPAMLEEAPPSTMRAWRSPRSWHLAVNLLAACDIHRASRDEVRFILGGAIGEEAAHAFLVWRANADLPDPWDVLAGKVTWLGRRPDEVFVIAAAVIDTWLQTIGRDVDDKRLDRAAFARFWADLDGAHPEIATTQGYRAFTACNGLGAKPPSSSADMFDRLLLPWVMKLSQRVH